MLRVHAAAEPRHLIDGAWCEGDGSQEIDVFDPATGQLLAEVKEATNAEVDAAVESAASAFENWAAMPITARAQYLFRIKAILANNVEPLAAQLTLDQGKTLSEAQAEIGRAIEFLDAAIAAPMLMRGDSAVEIARGVDTEIVREPIGVCVAITPFNFPVMNPTLFAAWALVCGNTLVLKPSEQDPLVATLLVKFLLETGLPKGVLNLVHGARDVAHRLITHRKVAAVSAIASTPVARTIYETASATGKRVQANGGAKNPVVVMPDADLGRAVDGILSSAFGMAGQRCLAVSRLITVGAVHEEIVERLCEAAQELVVGSGIDPRTMIGPVISSASRERIERSVQAAIDAGATAAVDGRGVVPQGGPEVSGGYYVGPTVLTGVAPDASATREEIFGPVITVQRVGTLDEAIDVCNDTEFGNAASIFTTSGAAARAFRCRSTAGNIGINVGVAAPTAPFSVGGRGASFYGDLHVSGHQSIAFYTDHKCIISRW